MILLSVCVFFMGASVAADQWVRDIANTRVIDKKRTVSRTYDDIRVAIALLGLIAALYGCCSLCLIRFRNSCLCICWQGLCLTMLMTITLAAAVPLLLVTVYADTAV